ncbi:MAG TPA: hypothetical protein VGR22_03215 [Thermomicrobiales bacterium]|nr:hypothetical protein [Thermomicrobiales bacterium]
MSIRKPSATTGRPGPGKTDRRDGHLRLVALVTGVAMALGVLVGCSEGTSQDAERGQQQDARRTSVVSDLQATRSARVLEPGTPPPLTATATP